MLQDSTLAFSREGTALAATHDGQVMNKGEMIVNGPVENTRRLFLPVSPIVGDVNLFTK